MFFLFLDLIRMTAWQLLEMNLVELCTVIYLQWCHTICLMIKICLSSPYSYVVS